MKYFSMDEQTLGNSEHPITNHSSLKMYSFCHTLQKGVHLGIMYPFYKDGFARAALSFR